MTVDPSSGGAESRPNAAGREERRPNPFGCFDRRYALEVLPAIAALLVAVVISLTLPRTPGVRIALAALACFAVAYLIVVSVLAVRRLDELQQKIQLLAIATSFTATGVVLALAVLLERLGMPVLDGMGLVTFMFVVWGLSVSWWNGRYR